MGNYYKQEELEQQINEQIDFEKLTELCEHLKDAVREIFSSCGLYFRIFSRVKTAESIENKILRGQYGTPENPRNLQDLIGLRVVLYYYDDLSICRDIMESTFQMLDDWSKTNYNADEFKATKINGVFKFPDEYFKLYTKELWNLPIDTTFEIQFRTVFFEGWHEIEHDMRYKSILTDAQFWQGSEELSRILNCILANLELSDWSLVQLFEQLSYNHYKNMNWELMLKSHYRIKMDDQSHLDPQILEVFNGNKEIAKKFFKCSRQTLIRELLKLDNPHVTYNLIVRLLNHRIVHDEQIQEIYNAIPREQPDDRAFQRTMLTRLETNTLFALDVPLLHKEVRKLTTEFTNASLILYKWARFKLNPIFGDISTEISSYYSNIPGFELEIVYNPDHFVFTMVLNHIDAKLPGTLWHVLATIKQDGDNLLHFTQRTTRDTPYGTTRRETFSKPSFIADLSNKIGLVDGVRLGSKAFFVETQEQYQSLFQLIHASERKLPIIVILQQANYQDKTDLDFRDGYDMDSFTINGTRLAKVVGLYSHVYMMNRTFLSNWYQDQLLSPEDADGCIMIFWPAAEDRRPELFTKAMVTDAQFDFNRFAFHDDNIYEKAFRHKLVQMIKDDNINH